MGLPANDPFAVADELLEANPSVAGTLVDVHMEATAEKAATAFHLDGRVTTVLGTHTHVPTADARVLPRGTAFHTPYEMGSGDERLCGALVILRPGRATASSITPFQYGGQTLSS